jgi:hypothetical protein
VTIINRFQPERSIMSTPSSGITLRTIQEAMPEYYIDTDLVDGVLTAMPPPPPGASAAWRRARLTRIIEEVAARVPMDAAQGHLAGQLVVVEFLADDMLGRITTPGLAMAERRLAIRTADDLLRSVARLERTLERRQERVMPFRDVGAVDGFDLAALDGVWCRGVPAAAAEPVAPPAAPGPEAGEPEAGPAPETPEPARPQAERDAAVIGQATGAGGPDRRAGVGRAGVTVEQGDGWTLEVWPARPGAATADTAMADTATADTALADTALADTAMADQGIADRGTADRPGPRGAA